MLGVLGRLDHEAVMMASDAALRSCKVSPARVDESLCCK
jgi:hypothetical protein